MSVNSDASIIIQGEDVLFWGPESESTRSDTENELEKSTEDLQLLDSVDLSAEVEFIQTSDKIAFIGFDSASTEMDVDQLPADVAETQCADLADEIEANQMEPQSVSLAIPQVEVEPIHTLLKNVGERSRRKSTIGRIEADENFSMGTDEMDGRKIASKRDRKKKFVVPKKLPLLKIAKVTKIKEQEKKEKMWNKDPELDPMAKNAVLARQRRVRKKAEELIKILNIQELKDALEKYKAEVAENYITKKEVEENYIQKDDTAKLIQQLIACGHGNGNTILVQLSDGQYYGEPDWMNTNMDNEPLLID